MITHTQSRRQGVPDPDPILGRAEVSTLLVAATRAPSLHNSQPWAFTVGPQHVEIHADHSRHLRHADSTGRALLVSCGAALFNRRTRPQQARRLVRSRFRPSAIAHAVTASTPWHVRRWPARSRRVACSNAYAALGRATPCRLRPSRLREQPASVGAVRDAPVGPALPRRTDEPGRPSPTWVGSATNPAGLEGAALS